MAEIMSCASSSDPSADAQSDTSGTDGRNSVSSDSRHNTGEVKSNTKQRTRHSGSFSRSLQSRARCRPVTAGYRKSNRTQFESAGHTRVDDNIKHSKEESLVESVWTASERSSSGTVRSGKWHSSSSSSRYSSRGHSRSSQGFEKDNANSNRKSGRTRVISNHNNPPRATQKSAEKKMNTLAQDNTTTESPKSVNEYVWQYRPPPRGLTTNEYTLCHKIATGVPCPYGDRCTMAHSADELNEWKDYFECWKTNIKHKTGSLKDCQYAERLMEKWMNAEHPETILTDEVDGVKVYINGDLSVCVNSKSAKHSWLFTVASKTCLSRAILLDSLTRRHFYIDAVTVGPKNSQRSQHLESYCQQWTNEKCSPGKSASEKVYRIKVQFQTEIYGTFRQSLVLEFGANLPAVVRQLCVDCKPVDIELLTLNKELVTDQTDVWSLTGKTLVPFEPRPSNMLEDDLNLVSLYPSPFGTDFTISPSLLEPVLTKDNYSSRMHHLLYVEEIAQYSSISKYNRKVDIQLVDRFMLVPGASQSARFAQNGELFAQVSLGKNVCEDTVEGRLVLYNVNTVYLVPIDDVQHADLAYEAIVEEKGKSVIYLRLSSRCVSDLELAAGASLSALVQFSLNRVPLCEVHQAIDRLSNIGLIFPELPDSSLSDSLQSVFDKSIRMKCADESRLNERQRNAVLITTTPLQIPLPPLLIIGPYGTGKTFTMAQTAIEILQQPDTCVLICTHSNSAADLYIKDYIDPFVVGGRHPEAVPLRIVYRHRWMQAIHPTVLKYCLLNTDPSVSGGFRMPDIKEVQKHRLIIATLSTSRYLCDLHLDKGFFTHILIDEVAQAMECECLLPLNLASSLTRVVLAGDHMQLNPEVYSEFARNLGLNKSLLERLFELYSACGDSPLATQCTVRLCENYRSHGAIIDFTSELFYAGGLVAASNQPTHKEFYPLSFFTARGDDEQHVNSTAFYNNAEVYEVVDRVCELQKKWPDSWGEFKPAVIGVVTPYHDQVLRIRSELRKRKLGSVCVERVSNVQGKEFRAIFLSTVRTNRTCMTQSGSLQDEVDYGFLSNVKLLNTAITRAQSLVAVIGDPIALCTVGNCRNFWLRFLEICRENKSLHGISWSQLQSQLDHVELKKTYVLNPLAPEFVPNRLRHVTLSGAAATAALSSPPSVPSNPKSRSMTVGYLSPPLYSPSVPVMPPQYHIPAQMMQPCIPLPYWWAARHMAAMGVERTAIFSPIPSTSLAIPARCPIPLRPFPAEVMPRMSAAVTNDVNMVADHGHSVGFGGQYAGVPFVAKETSSPLPHGFVPYNPAVQSYPVFYPPGAIRPIPVMVAGVPLLAQPLPVKANIVSPSLRAEGNANGDGQQTVNLNSMDGSNERGSCVSKMTPISGLTFLPTACNVQWVGEPRKQPTAVSRFDEQQPVTISQMENRLDGDQQFVENLFGAKQLVPNLHSARDSPSLANQSQYRLPAAGKLPEAKQQTACRRLPLYHNGSCKSLDDQLECYNGLLKQQEKTLELKSQTNRTDGQPMINGLHEVGLREAGVSEQLGAFRQNTDIDGGADGLFPQHHWSPMLRTPAQQSVPSMMPFAHTSLSLMSVSEVSDSNSLAVQRPQSLPQIDSTHHLHSSQQNVTPSEVNDPSLPADSYKDVPGKTILRGSEALWSIENHLPSGGSLLTNSSNNWPGSHSSSKKCDEVWPRDVGTKPMETETWRAPGEKLTGSTVQQLRGKLPTDQPCDRASQQLTHVVQNDTIVVFNGSGSVALSDTRPPLYMRSSTRTFASAVGQSPVRTAHSAKDSVQHFVGRSFAEEEFKYLRPESSSSFSEFYGAPLNVDCQTGSSHPVSNETVCPPFGGVDGSSASVICPGDTKSSSADVDPLELLRNLKISPWSLPVQSQPLYQRSTCN